MTDMLVRFSTSDHRLLHETRMPSVPRVGELIELPSGRASEVIHVGYLIDDHGPKESVAIVRVTGP